MTLLVNGKEIDYTELPPHMRDGMRLYMEHGIHPGSFLTAILCNDLLEAAVRADDVNKHLLFEYVQWLYNHAPAGSWGSEENYLRWIKSYEKGDEQP